MSCVCRIRQSLSSLTPNEQSIAEYILKHRTEVLSMSSQTLGQKTHTSAAALIRFVKKLGYDGYSAMKIDLAQDTDDCEYRLDEIIAQEDTFELMVKKVQKQAKDNISKTYKLLNIAHLKAAIQLLLQARRIYLVGVGGSGIVCFDLLQKLSRINREVIFYTDSSLLLSSLAHISQDDVLLAVSYSGETKLANLALEAAHTNGAKVIAITQCNYKSSLAKRADITLFTPVEEKEIRLGAISSRNAAFVLTDLIYFGIAKDDLDHTHECLVKTRALHKKSNEKK